MQVCVKHMTALFPAPAVPGAYLHHLYSTVSGWVLSSLVQRSLTGVADLCRTSQQTCGRVHLR